MQTNYAQNIDRMIQGMALLGPRRARPLQIASKVQILRLTITAGAGTSDVVLTLTDNETKVATEITVSGSANEATLGAAIIADWRANPKLNSLFAIAGVTVVDASNIVIDFTARHPNRAYSLAVTGGPSGTAPAVVETQAPGGVGLEFGQLVARGSGDDEFAQLSASSTVRDIAGALVRTDANHFADVPRGTADLCPVGVHMPIHEVVEMVVRVEEAVTPASRPHVRIEANASYGIGSWGATRQGTAQVATFTPAANMLSYVVRTSVVVNGREIPLEFSYSPTDATTSTDDAVDGLEDAAAAAITAAGLTDIVTASAASASTTFTLTLAAGYTWALAPHFSSYNLDAEVVAGTVDAGTADVDMLDVSEIARYTSSASAGALAKVLVRVAP